VQQTLLEAHRDRGQCRGSGSGEVAGWLRGILANKLANAARFHRRDRRDVARERSLERSLEESSARLEAWLAAGGPSPSAHADRNEQLLRLAAALTRLPDAQRQAVELRYLQGWPVKAIADHLGRTPAAVGGLLHRGLAVLQTLLADPPRPE
jgi:RNA polymerase sigma-70 factor (ECF subfamily)